MKPHVRADPPGVTVIIPAKDLRRAKSRLALTPASRRRIALELLRRTVSIAVSSGHVGLVIVVTSDPQAACVARESGAVIVHERRPWGLNSALAQARARARQLAPTSHVAVVVADLPRLRVQDLDTVLAAVGGRRGRFMVSDADSTGTTMLIHSPDEDPPFMFGKDSAAHHARTGYELVPSAPGPARQDLDTRAHLAHALTMEAP